VCKIGVSRNSELGGHNGSLHQRGSLVAKAGTSEGTFRGKDALLAARWCPAITGSGSGDPQDREKDKAVLLDDECSGGWKCHVSRAAVGPGHTVEQLVRDLHLIRNSPTRLLVTGWTGGAGAGFSPS